MQFIGVHLRQRQVSSLDQLGHATELNPGATCYAYHHGMLGACIPLNLALLVRAAV